MPAKKKKPAKKRSRLAPASPTPAGAVIGIAKAVGDQLIASTAAWTEIRRIADAELARLAGRP